MRHKFRCVWLGLLAIACGGSASAGPSDGAADQPIIATDYWVADERTAIDWATGSLSLNEWEGLDGVDSAPAEGSIIDDPALEPVQMQSPAFQTPSRRQPTATRNSRSASRAAAESGLASVPYMIGDTGAGTCLGFSGLLDVGLAHPTLACSRLNVAEANSPLPTDRVYYSYRHFDNATPVSVYQFEKELDVDRHTMAFERTYWDGMCSVEMRLPIEYRLTSEFYSYFVGGTNDLIVAPEERRAELGNVSLIFKSLLVEREALAVSAGLGVTLPTARDVEYSVAISGTIDYPNSPGISADTNTAFSTVFSNETVYLLPFLAWIYAPRERWFHQGFLQIETAANTSRVTAYGEGFFDFYENGVPTGDFYSFFTGRAPAINAMPVREELFSQTLLRANLGWGYHLWESGNIERSGVAADRLTGLFEVHYTSTLEDANLSTVEMRQFGTTPANLQNIQIGNVDNRVDILNLASGVSMLIGNTTLTTGAVVPVRGCPDCGFDVEYNMQLQRQF